MPFSVKSFDTDVTSFITILNLIIHVILLILRVIEFMQTILCDNANKLVHRATRLFTDTSANNM